MSPLSSSSSAAAALSSAAATISSGAEMYALASSGFAAAAAAEAPASSSTVPLSIAVAKFSEAAAAFAAAIELMTAGLIAAAAVTETAPPAILDAAIADPPKAAPPAAADPAILDPDETSPPAPPAAVDPAAPAVHVITDPPAATDPAIISETFVVDPAVHAITDPPAAIVSETFAIDPAVHAITDPPAAIVSETFAASYVDGDSDWADWACDSLPIGFAGFMAGDAVPDEGGDADGFALTVELVRDILRGLYPRAFEMVVEGRNSEAIELVDRIVRLPSYELHSAAHVTRSLIFSWCATTTPRDDDRRRYLIEAIVSAERAIDLAPNSLLITWVLITMLCDFTILTRHTPFEDRRFEGRAREAYARCKAATFVPTDPILEWVLGDLPPPQEDPQVRINELVGKLYILDRKVGRAHSPFWEERSEVYARSIRPRQNARDGEVRRRSENTLWLRGRESTDAWVQGSRPRRSLRGDGEESSRTAEARGQAGSGGGDAARGQAGGRGQSWSRSRTDAARGQAGPGARARGRGRGRAQGDGGRGRGGGVREAGFSFPPPRRAPRSRLEWT